MIATVRKNYPPNWEQLAAECRERAGNTCEHCGIAQHTPLISKKGNPYYVYLHAAHRHQLDQGNENPDLVCLCPTCHSRYDYEHRQRMKRIHLERIKHLRRLIEIGLVTARMEAIGNG